MEEQIKRAMKRLSISYSIFWIIPFILFIIGSFELVPVGQLAADEVASYYMETIGILLTAALVPLSLKLFSLVLRRRIDQLSPSDGIDMYVQWSTIRLILLEIVVVFNLVSYFLVVSDTGGLCMLIGLVASLFCIPGEKKLCNELNLTEDEEA